MGLYPYQAKGAAWLASKRRAYLADVPGLGKTAQAIDAATQVGAENVLVLCPASALPVWRREIKKWSTPNVDREWTLVSYALLSSRGKRYVMELAGSNFDLVIADEAHFMKNRSSKRTQGGLYLCRQAPRIWMLSGTPVPNDPSELYAPLRAIWPDVLQALGVRTYQNFLDLFCHVIPGPYGPRVVGAKNVAMLREWLEKIMLRRTVEEVGIELPPLRVDIEPVGINSEWFYQEISELLGVEYTEIMERIEGILQSGEIPTNSFDLPIATIRRIIGTAKLTGALERITEEMEVQPDKKLVVMAYHRDVIDGLYAGLSRFGAVKLDGRTSPNERAEVVARFQQDIRVRVFIGQLTAAGTAITLTAANEIVLVEQMWSPEDNVQAIKRIHRISQDQPCRARLMSAEGTIDEAVLDVLARKQKMIEATYGTAKEQTRQ